MECTQPKLQKIGNKATEYKGSYFTVPKVSSICWKQSSKAHTFVRSGRKLTDGRSHSFTLGNQCSGKWLGCLDPTDRPIVYEWLKGPYDSFTVDTCVGKTCTVIMLKTRYHRQLFWIKNKSRYWYGALIPTIILIFAELSIDRGIALVRSDGTNADVKNIIDMSSQSSIHHIWAGKVFWVCYLYQWRA